MKFICQHNYPDKPYITRLSLTGEDYQKGQKTTIKTSGCGLCSAVMVAHRLIPEIDFDIDDAIQLSYESKANLTVGTSYKHFAPAFRDKFGFIMEETSDPERLRYCLRTGGAAVGHVGGDQKDYIGVFSHNGHYIAIISEESDGRIAILDPGFKEGKFEEDGRKGKVEVKDGFIALCHMDVLVKDSASRTPSFHLFWRK